MTNVAVIYARVSSLKQVREGNGLSSQITISNEHCKNNGFEPVEIFEDNTTGVAMTEKDLTVSSSGWRATRRSKS